MMLKFAIFSLLVIAIAGLFDRLTGGRDDGENK